MFALIKRYTGQSSPGREPFQLGYYQGVELWAQRAQYLDSAAAEAFLLGAQLGQTLRPIFFSTREYAYRMLALLGSAWQDAVPLEASASGCLDQYHGLRCVEGSTGWVVRALSHLHLATEPGWRGHSMGSYQETQSGPADVRYHCWLVDQARSLRVFEQLSTAVECARAQGWLRDAVSVDFLALNDGEWAVPLSISAPLRESGPWAVMVSGLPAAPFWVSQWGRYFAPMIYGNTDSTLVVWDDDALLDVRPAHAVFDDHEEARLLLEECLQRGATSARVVPNDYHEVRQLAGAAQDTCLCVAEANHSDQTGWDLLWGRGAGSAYLLYTDALLPEAHREPLAFAGRRVAWVEGGLLRDGEEARRLILCDMPDQLPLVIRTPWQALSARRFLVQHSALSEGQVKITATCDLPAALTYWLGSSTTDRAAVLEPTPPTVGAGAWQHLRLRTSTGAARRVIRADFAALERRVAENLSLSAAPSTTTPFLTPAHPGQVSTHGVVVGSAPALPSAEQLTEALVDANTPPQRAPLPALEDHTAAPEPPASSEPPPTLEVFQELLTPSTAADRQRIYQRLGIRDCPAREILTQLDYGSLRGWRREELLLAAREKSGSDIAWPAVLLCDLFAELRGLTLRFVGGKGWVKNACSILREHSFNHVRVEPGTHQHITFRGLSGDAASVRASLASALPLTHALAVYGMLAQTGHEVATPALYAKTGTRRMTFDFKTTPEERAERLVAWSRLVNLTYQGGSV